MCPQRSNKECHASAQSRGGRDGEGLLADGPAKSVSSRCSETLYHKQPLGGKDGVAKSKGTEKHRATTQ